MKYVVMLLMAVSAVVSAGEEINETFRFTSGFEKNSKIKKYWDVKEQSSRRDLSFKYNLEGDFEITIKIPKLQGRGRLKMNPVTLYLDRDYNSSVTYQLIRKDGVINVKKDGKYVESKPNVKKEWKIDKIIQFMTLELHDKGKHGYSVESIKIKATVSEKAPAPKPNKKKINRGH